MTRALRTALLTLATAATATALIASASMTASAATPAAASSASTAAVKPLTASALQTTSNRTFYRGGLYVQAQSQAAKAAATLTAQGDATGAASANYIAKRSVAIWLGEWYQGSTLVTFLKQTIAAAEAKGTTPVFVTYAIPDRDCSGYSAGGLTNSTYLPWNQTIASTLAGHRAVVLVEPDAISQTTGACADDASTRLPLLAAAVKQFATAGIPSYLDGGNSAWLTPTEQASLLEKAGISNARGFFTNVSNFNGVDPERAYANQVSALTGGSHFVIDVSRNGKGAVGGWCNPTGAGLGQSPLVTGGTTKLDALLWVKTPGSSDGYCNGGPAAGSWFASSANALVANRKQ